ncbi:DNA translocase FtsK [Rickettsia conorii subsp. heilongjiangensis]|uniref:DNA translocase FtsK n=1 Tax=Rickettsia conorii subsp. heilongjiangensis TaxID=226665 RepID=A0AAD1LT10_RICCR|nr:DNA translocase FtsK [Rickettsia conorii]AEK75235.1 Cell division protein FtsK [Rickettsia conorii subsp. heilongjiangensis 054]BBM91966.1 DNA translocase FtsK [Rickettsia conorii subsp. heilongjiangensis]BBM93175.1 DNA translocase FtsK [Rickettsia conorii subsp. heilongjiangensis]BBM94384.1 DNA translocase FtsK [Rickettsia conorii subsp. heilongjiangensis]BBM95593.1 DNA translocase FtsK [Rickettsia conorii subsp. heilongjiangensis]
MLYYINKILSNNKVQAVILGIIGLGIVTVLTSYNIDDPSFNSVTTDYHSNLVGIFGSYLSDCLYQFFGLAAFIIPLACFVWGRNCWYGRYRGSFIRMFVMLLALVSSSTLLSKIKLEFIPANAGGAIGIIASNFFERFTNQLYLLLIFFTFIILVVLFEIKFTSLSNFIIKLGKFLIYRIQSFLHNVFSRLSSIRLFPTKNNDKINITSSYQKPVSEKVKFPEEARSVPANPIKFFSKPVSPKISQSEIAELPPISLLRDPENHHVKGASSSELKQKAEELLTVLNDFGVKGQIININQGPVVTQYEFEPAAGTKTSRVVGLSDDIARSLSALSTRIAVIPGKNVLGIELPNKQREFFCLKELIETPEYQDKSTLLPLVLGKDLAGKPLIADLAKMPHLLVAGTTGSGKSVGINAMIVSLLYRYTPEECRFIMIDPKMLELSAYDGIPHLLTPVVTEPSKAVVALKWAVKEMENRYRMMSNIGVKNIAGYNAKILEAVKEKRVIERSIQTGFDPETGKPIYETVTMNMEKLPYIVVIVDEMADLMLVAGKDIEMLIQRLAQMARAAGIHIIMATQRPSVDVITGVIKANFPSRISFKVTSKIDSRTILGEQGSEQLLGMGDMLFMGSTSKISRVHGPFVNEAEIEQITEYLKESGTPEYISAVTEQPEEDDSSIDIGDGTSDEVLYKKAVQIVRYERKSSISYIQRSLRIGYNKAANLVEKMEKEGIVSPPNHTGKREILLPER